MKVGFVGAGKVGCSLGMLFATTQHNLVGFYSRTSSSAAEAADFTKSKHFSNLETLIKECDAVFITVPDDAISVVWEQLKHMSIAGKMICHCSGSLSSEIFKGIDETGAFGFSVHPLLAVSDRYKSYQELPKSLFTIEGEKGHISDIKALLEASGLKYTVINADVKTRYHGAAVLCSNLVVALIQAAEDELRICGFSEEQLSDAIAPLLLGNVNKVLAVGTENALTGPIERNDVGTVQKHLNTFDGIDRDIYQVLSRKTVEIAKRKNSNRDYSDLEALLNTQEDLEE
ncbi:Predicted oxidoreductase, contains short-chain dehydrogenase (SDR) and DUF2520 domains [Pseudobutyrivibrio sp. YE44]|uniref:Rossmann-like and DUF2520 domain-containing protein n=1 Tax=Pseudobutyrivibrio sp. YE44 TaxID=1520802 RepID=UPI00087F35D5|nr:Rossmann-like and DUF2520 domain-containing protein [Pseudobutyrivibrio sp. YE44]SDB23459.1 Predicted oxidoreductase, contains short-chain dehydrogenase (SDR) and DUF2520 domains [Pseudobutyrivibrio sp. YE44]